MHRIRQGIFITAAMALATPLPGCADAPRDTPLASMARACMAQNARFIDGWGCVQARLADGPDGGADTRLKQVQKVGDDLASRVAARSLKDADAKQRLAAVLPVEDTGPAELLSELTSSR